MHEYYSVDKFKAAYQGYVPSIPDKSCWPKATHGFFMHPPLLKSIAGRHKNRMKSSMEGGSSSKGTGKKRHKCPICKELGHHWYKCNNGNPEDIVAMELER